MSSVQRLLRVLFCIAVAVGVVLPATAANADPSPEEVERQLEAAHNELENIIEDYNRIGEELKATRNTAAALNQKLVPLQGDLDAARADVGKIATVAYKSGGDLTATSLLLSASSPNTVISHMQAMERLARSRQRDLSDFTATKQQYDGEKKRVDDLLTTQLQQHAQLTERKTKIEAELKRLEEVERRLNAARPARPAEKSTGSLPPAPVGTGKGAIAARFAHAQIGKMYQFGADGPNTYDCSGLTQAAWRAAGVNLPHNARMQYNSTPKVSRANLQVGDLVYYRGLGHVGIYVGDEKIVHASRTGKPVAAVPINNSGTPYGYSRPG